VWRKKYKAERPNYRGKDGQLYLVRCPQCERENYAMNVALGVCAWCGWDETKNIKPSDGDKWTR